MARAYAYLRKSSVRNLGSDLAPETQEREVRALAARHGDDDLILLADWDVSGRGEYTTKRTGYLALREAIKSGACSAVYSYSLSRLGRSVHELTGLFALCDEKKVPLRLVVDAVDTGTASGRLIANVLASVAQFESEVASERQRARNLTKTLRGESLRTSRYYGEAEGEDPETVMQVFRETGSYTAAAKRLNEMGVKPRSGKYWWSSSVRVVVMRLDPNLQKPGKGRRAKATFALSRLLRCPTCGTFLTGGNTPNRHYTCRRSESLPHPRRVISESKVLPWVRAHTEGYVLSDHKVDNSIERRDLSLARSRLVDLVQEGLLSKEEFRERVEQIDRLIEGLDARVQAPDRIDWSEDETTVNAHLRRLLDHIELDKDFRPVRLVFRWEAEALTRWASEDAASQMDELLEKGRPLI